MEHNGTHTQTHTHTQQSLLFHSYHHFLPFLYFKLVLNVHLMYPMKLEIHWKKGVSVLFFLILSTTCSTQKMLKDPHWWALTGCFFCREMGMSSTFLPSLILRNLSRIIESMYLWYQTDLSSTVGPATRWLRKRRQLPSSFWGTITSSEKWA